VVERLVERTGLPLTEAPDHFAAQSSRDALVELSGQLRVVAISMVKVANDLRWMGSGPRAGLAEIRLPDLQPGSSIMPGKVNPVLPEAVLGVAGQVIGNDAAVAFAGQQGAFELNVAMPLLARNLLESIRLLANVGVVFAERGIDGLEVDVDRCRSYAEASPAVATSLGPWLGYDLAAEVVKESMATGRSVRDVVRQRALLDDEQLERALDVMALTRGGLVR
jgi:fumarate hydratase class II